MGVPGPVTSATSQGVHQLIRTRNALVVTDGAEVLEAISPVGEHLASPRHGAVLPRDLVTAAERQVLDAVPVSRAAPVASIARAAGMSVAVVRAALLVLARSGLVAEEGAGWRVLREAGDRPLDAPAGSEGPDFVG